MPKSNSQRTPNFQFPREPADSEPCHVGSWSLEMPWELEVGSWELSQRLSTKADDGAVVGADDDDAARDGRRGGHRRAGFVLPDRLAGGEIEHVEAAVVRPDVDARPGHGGRRFDARPRRERPHGLAAGGIDGVHDLVTSAEDHLAV